jgi:hypothetical protein
MPGHNIRAPETLRLELRLVELGLYRLSTPGHPLSVFEDSPICLRYLVNSCASCALIKCAPYGCRRESVPCHRIRLNQAHETVDSLFRTGMQQELEEAPREWLTAISQRLEQEEVRAQGTEISSRRNSVRTVTEGGLHDKPCSAT